jgi:hypothetical protein
MNGPVRGLDPVKYVSMNLIACLPALHQPKTPYKGGKFKLKVKFGDSYPFKAPTVSTDYRLWDTSKAAKDDDLHSSHSPLAPIIQTSTATESQ